MSKFELLKAWMAENNVTMRWAAAQMGVTPSLLSKYLRLDTMPQKRHEQLVQLHFPPDLLPEPVNKPRGARPAIPVWLQ